MFATAVLLLNFRKQKNFYYPPTQLYLLASDFRFILLKLSCELTATHSQTYPKSKYSYALHKYKTINTYLLSSESSSHQTKFNSDRQRKSSRLTTTVTVKKKTEISNTVSNK